MHNKVACETCLSLLPAGGLVCAFCGANVSEHGMQKAAEIIRLQKAAEIFRLLSPDEIREINAGHLGGAEFDVVLEQARLRAAQAAADDMKASDIAANDPALEIVPLSCRNCNVILTPRDAFDIEFHFARGVEDDSDRADFDRSDLLGRGERPPPTPTPDDSWAGMNVIGPGETGTSIAKRMSTDPMFQKRMQEDDQFARTTHVKSLLAELADALGMRIRRALCMPCPKCGEADPLGVARDV